MRASRYHGRDLILALQVLSAQHGLTAEQFAKIAGHPEKDYTTLIPLKHESHTRKQLVFANHLNDTEIAHCVRSFGQLAHYVNGYSSVKTMINHAQQLPGSEQVPWVRRYDDTVESRTPIHPDLLPQYRQAARLLYRDLLANDDFHLGDYLNVDRKSVSYWLFQSSGPLNKLSQINALGRFCEAIGAHFHEPHFTPSTLLEVAEARYPESLVPASSSPQQKNQSPAR